MYVCCVVGRWFWLFVRTRFAGFALCCYCFLCEQLWLGDAGAFGFALPWRVLGEWTPSRQRLAL